MDIKKREFKMSPPKEPITSLGAIVRDYKWRFPRDRRDMVWDYCRLAPNLDSAVERACASRGIDGKMHNHQTRVAGVARLEFSDRIKRQRHVIMRIMNQGARPEYEFYEDPFDALHDLFDDIKPGGIGPVTLYDVATRIGAYLDVHPTSLYVHAGVRLGLMQLQWSLPKRHLVSDGTKWYRDVWKLPRLTVKQMHTWWPEFDGLPPDEVEDLLCTYRDCFIDIEEGKE